MGQVNAAHLYLHGSQNAHALLPGQAQAAVPGKIEGAFRHISGHGVHPGQGFGLFRLNLADFLQLRTPETVFVDQPDKLQSLEQLIKLGTVIRLDDGIHGGKVNGCLRADSSQVIGKIGLFLIVHQLFPELGPDGFVVNVFIYPIQAAKFRQQLLGGLGANARHTGDIVGGIAHEGLQVDELFGLEAILFLEQFSSIKGRRGLAGLGDHQLYMDVFIDQL